MRELLKLFYTHTHIYIYAGLPGLLHQSATEVLFDINNTIEYLSSEIDKNQIRKNKKV